MGDGKWIHYNNVERKRSWGSEWTTTRRTKGWSSSRDGDAVYMLGWEGVLYQELLLENQTTNSNQCCSNETSWKQLSMKSVQSSPTENAESSIRRTRDCMFPWWPDRAKTVPAWLGSPDSSLYSADTAPSDFRLFQSLQSSLNGKTFSSLEYCRGTWNGSLL